MDVVAGDLFAGLANVDGLAALAADVDALAVVLPAHLSHGHLLYRSVHHLQLLDATVYLERTCSAMVDLQVLQGFFAQSDNVQLLRLVILQQVDWMNLRHLSNKVTRSNQRHVLSVSWWLCEECKPGLGCFCRDEVQFLILTWHKVKVAHTLSHQQLYLLLRAEGWLQLDLLLPGC